MNGLPRILPVIVEYTDIDPSAIRPTMTWEDLGIDSLERVEIAIEIEGLLGIHLDADEFETQGLTLGELAALVDRKMQEKSNG